MKKIFFALLLMVVSLSASAQFEKGTRYSNISLDGFGIGYNGGTGFNFGLSADYGYFIEDKWMLKGGIGYKYNNHAHDFLLNAGFRYYFKVNGFFTGLAAQYDYSYMSNNFKFVPEVGYCFYVNHFVSIEPSLYADLCCNNFSNASGIGVKLGVGFYY